MLDLDVNRAEELRSAFARQYDRGNADLEEIEKFATLADNLEGVDGLNSGPVDDFIQAGDSGNVRGALDEVRRADEIGSANIERMNIEVYDGKERVGELDIQVKESGKIVESKGSFGYDEQQVRSQFNKKLSVMEEHDSVAFDGNTLEVRANKIGDDDIVASQIIQMKKDISEMDESNHSNVDIKVVDESSDKIITG
ncbi:hypothetical protein [Haloarcula argentinensis]|uniref:Uncharacterized protein n=1 Tax=Haloarcula argentinensis TaxID=43776 RepID=A0ABU2F6E9_HALAR|nr:hypothetical protein [Haloarcula argentinensis]EMA26713.1 hypothetical protein C443_00052 [Haloarcula argentinensis DSM 12282]MDS0255803.1 hypothetical protein [Haloarcula argentinensis]